MPIPPPDPLTDPQAVFDTIEAVARTHPTYWRAIE